jgi:NAD(P)-dependent dehydrogenase (short-subunit alcohol dehydrogenase family)
MSSSLLTGRGAVVTGGSRGIGRAVAELLCHLGAGVVVNGRDPVAVQETVAAIAASGGRAAAVVGAADDERIATALVEECTNAFGRLDILINCAGIAEPAGSSILDITPAEFDALMSAHVGTAFHTCRVAARVMAAQGHGSIINTGSVAFLGDYGGTGYPAGKGAVNGLTMAIAAELKPHGVRANVAFDRYRLRKAHRGPASPRVARRDDDAGVTGQCSRRVCGAALRISRQRFGVRHDRSDLGCRRRIRGPL